MPLSVIQSSFARGVISPALYARVDQSLYYIALRVARNFVIHPYGGASNRAGLKYVGPIKNHSEGAYLLPFRFKGTDTYLLEFGDQYMRVVRRDGHILETAKTITGATQANPVVVTTSAPHGYSNGDDVYIDGIVGTTELNQRWFAVANVTSTTFELTSQTSGTNIDGSGYTAYSSGGEASKVYEISTPYSFADLTTLKFVQSADTITLTHTSHNPYNLTRTDHDAWTLSEVAFVPTQDPPSGVSVSVTNTGTDAMAYKVTAVKEDGTEESLPGFGATASITAITQADPAVVTSASHGLAVGDEVELDSIVGMTELNNRRFRVGVTTTNTFELAGEDSSAYTAYSSAGTWRASFRKITNGNAADTDNTISWSAPAGAPVSHYSVYRSEFGTYGFVGDTTALSFRDDNIAPDYAITPPLYRDPFYEADDKPGAVGYHQQRRVYGGSINRPDTNYFSRTGNFANMSAASPPQSDDAITATLSSREVNEIRHYVSARDLIVLTGGSEWQVNSGGEAVFSAETISQTEQDTRGASHHTPFLIDKTVIYVRENKSEVRGMAYSITEDGYLPDNLSLMAHHLLQEYPVYDNCAALSPDPTLIYTRTDGGAAVLTFNKAQEVIAWTEWVTLNGDLEATAAIRPNIDTDTDDAAYFVVKRKIGGETVRYIERTASRKFFDVRDCFFVDSGLTYDLPIEISGVTAADPVVVTTSSAHGLSNGDEVDIYDIEWEPDFDDQYYETQPDQLNASRYTVANVTSTTFELTDGDGVDVDGSAFNAYVKGGTARLVVQTVTGLWHLEGQTGIVALVDGDVVEGLTVANGSITMPQKFSRAHIGIRMIADLETLDIENQQGTIQGFIKSVPSVTLRLQDSRGMLIGPREGLLTPWIQREDEDWGDPVALFTGDHEQTLEPDWNSHGRVMIRQPYPLPFTLLAAIPQVEIEESD
tara:strand:+ start:5749 stop:8559 length:2811 start_codon:yes stop_codon:yes gene_type:complete